MKLIGRALSRRTLLRVAAGLVPVLAGVRFGGAARALAPGILPAIAYETGNGAWFPTEIGSAEGFFLIDYHTGPKFWTAYKELGGNSVLGDPISRPWEEGANWFQLFNKALMVHPVEGPAAFLANLTETLLAAGRGDSLVSRDMPAKKTGEFDEATRLSWLTDAVIREFYAPRGDFNRGKARYGLPISDFRPLGPLNTQLTERVAIQHFVTGAFGPQGTAVLVALGDWFLEWGMLTPDAGAKDNVADGAQPPVGSTREIVIKQPRVLGGDPEFPGGNLGPDRRFGGVLASDLLIYGEPENVDDLNVAWTREQFHWDVLPQFDDSKLDLTATDRNYRTALEVVGLAVRTPNYANGNRGNQVPPDGLDLPWNDPNNHWGQFLNSLARSRLPTQTVTTKGGDVKRAAGDRNPVAHWIVWNEPDICVHAHPGFSWNHEKRAAVYLLLLKTAWHAVKSASLDLGVIFGSLGIVDAVCSGDKTEVYFWNELVKALKADPAAAANNFYFDHMSLNLHKEPERVGEMIKRYREAMNALGMTGKQVWLMEMGAPTKTEPIDPKQNSGLFVTPEEQKHFLTQAYANALVAGAARISVYKMRDYLLSSTGHVALRTALKFLKNTYELRGTKTPNRYGPEMYKYSGLVRIDLPGPGFVTTVIYNRGADAKFISATFQGAGGPIVKAGVDGKEERLALGAVNLGIAGATALYHAPWGQKIYFVGGGTTMFRYPDTVRMLTPTIRK